MKLKRRRKTKGSRKGKTKARRGNETPEGQKSQRQQAAPKMTAGGDRPGEPAGRARKSAEEQAWLGDMAMLRANLIGEEELPRKRSEEQGLMARD